MQVVFLNNSSQIILLKIIFFFNFSCFVLESVAAMIHIRKYNLLENTKLKAKLWLRCFNWIILKTLSQYSKAQTDRADTLSLLLPRPFPCRRCQFISTIFLRWFQKYSYSLSSYADLVLLVLPCLSILNTNFHKFWTKSILSRSSLSSSYFSLPFLCFNMHLLFLCLFCTSRDLGIF